MKLRGKCKIFVSFLLTIFPGEDCFKAQKVLDIDRNPWYSNINYEIIHHMMSTFIYPLRNHGSTVRLSSFLGNHLSVGLDWCAVATSGRAQISDG